MAKHRGTVFAVLRTAAMNVGFADVKVQPTIIGVYFSMERAEEIAAKYAQEMTDRKIEGLFFEVIATTYYDE